MRTSINYYCKRWWDVWLGFVLIVKHKLVVYLLQTEDFCKSSSFGGLSMVTRQHHLALPVPRQNKNFSLPEGQLAENHQSLWCSHYHKSLHCLPQPWLPRNTVIWDLSVSSPNLPASINTKHVTFLAIQTLFPFNRWWLPLGATVDVPGSQLPSLPHPGSGWVTLSRHATLLWVTGAGILSFQSEGLTLVQSISYIDIPSSSSSPNVCTFPS